MDQKMTLVDIIKLIYKRRKMILIATLSVSAITAIIMLFMPNYYKATTTFYAASPDLVKPDPIGNSLTRKKYYGSNDDIDRILTVANSAIIRQKLIKKFDLYTHYDIDSTKKLSEFKINKKLSKLFIVKKNERDAIELSIEDKDQKLVSQMANTARELIKTEISNIVKSIQKSQIESYHKSVESKNKQLATLIDSIRNLKNKYSIFDIETQGESLASDITQAKGNLAFLQSKLKILQSSRGIPRDSISMIKANIAGNKTKLEDLDSLAKVFNSASMQVSMLVKQKNQLAAQLAVDNVKMNQLNSLYGSDNKVMHIVERAKTPLRKFRPKRSLYVIGAFILTLLFSILMVVIIEENKKINWN